MSHSGWSRDAQDAVEAEAPSRLPPDPGNGVSAGWLIFVLALPFAVALASIVAIGVLWLDAGVNPLPFIWMPIVLPPLSIYVMQRLLGRR